MSRKTLIYIFMAIGSAIGGWIPSLWNAGMFSFSGVIFTAIGGFAGIWLGFQLGE